MQLAVSIADIIYHLVAAVALIVGGGWAYFRFIRNRPLRPCLSIGVAGSLVTASDRPRLVVRCRAANVGLREVEIGGQATSLRVYFYGVEGEGPPAAAQLAEWQWLDSWPVFDSSGSGAVLEPDEPLEEQLLLELPRRGFTALRLELIVHSPPRRFWEVNEVVVLREAGDNGER